MSYSRQVVRPHRIIADGQMSGNIVSTVQDTDLIDNIGLQIEWTKVTAAADTALAGVASSLIVQDITYTAVTRGVDGDDIEIEYVEGVALAVAVLGTVITVTLETGVSDATAVKAAVDALPAAAALVTTAISGTASDVQVAEASTPLAGGVDSNVDATADTFTLTGHIFNTGLKIALTSSGTLPTGLSATDYYVIVVDANTIQLASTLANAEAGTPVLFTSQGQSGSTITFTPGNLAGTIKVQGSNSYNPHLGTGTFYDLSFAPSLVQPSNDSTGYLVSLSNYPWRYIRCIYTPTTGDGTLNIYLNGKAS